MKGNSVTLIVAIAALIISAVCLWEVHGLRQPMTAPPPASAIPARDFEARVNKLEAAAPDVGQIMLGLQTRFAKLYFAAEGRSWDLARFEREEVIEDLSTVASIKPDDNGVSLAGIIGAFTNSVDGPLASMKDAIDVSDRALFRKAYQDSLVMCNSCHQSTGRPFIVITVPTNPPVFNQQWEVSAAMHK